MKPGTLNEVEAALDAGNLQKAIDIIGASGPASAEDMRELARLLTAHHSEERELKALFPRRLVLVGRANGRPHEPYFRTLEEAKEIALHVEKALKIEGKKHLALQRVSNETGISVSTIKRRLQLLT